MQRGLTFPFQQNPGEEKMSQVLQGRDEPLVLYAVTDYVNGFAVQLRRTKVWLAKFRRRKPRSEKMEPVQIAHFAKMTALSAMRKLEMQDASLPSTITVLVMSKGATDIPDFTYHQQQSKWDYVLKEAS